MNALLRWLADRVYDVVFLKWMTVLTVRYARGRLHIFRDVPYWIVWAYSDIDATEMDGPEYMAQLRDEARAELRLRERRASREADHADQA